ncbi:hypothetical protein [Streptomyces spinosirectus]
MEHTSVRAGRSDLSAQPPLIRGMLLVPAAVLTELGLRPRLAEFR